MPPSAHVGAEVSMADWLGEGGPEKPSPLEAQIAAPGLARGHGKCQRRHSPSRKAIPASRSPDLKGPSQPIGPLSMHGAGHWEPDRTMGRCTTERGGAGLSGDRCVRRPYSPTHDARYGPNEGAQAHWHAKSACRDVRHVVDVEAQRRRGRRGCRQEDASWPTVRGEGATRETLSH